MIIEYHRPNEVEEAIRLLRRNKPKTLPLAGGTRLGQFSGEDIAVVDLQNLPLDQIEVVGNTLVIGSMVRLSRFIEENIGEKAIQQLIEREFPQNVRNMATIGGAILCENGRSELLAGLLALDVQLVWLPGSKEIRLGDYLALREHWETGSLLSEIHVPANVQFRSESVRRTPVDQPQLSVSVCRWPSGRTRIVVGGFGNAPQLVLDGPTGAGAEIAIRSLLRQANDEWASGEYRSEVGVVLLRRLMDALDEGKTA